jgi:hypothetical protein
MDVKDDLVDNLLAGRPPAGNVGNKAKSSEEISRADSLAYTPDKLSFDPILLSRDELAVLGRGGGDEASSA